MPPSVTKRIRLMPIRKKKISAIEIDYWNAEATLVDLPGVLHELCPDVTVYDFRATIDNLRRWVARFKIGLTYKSHSEAHGLPFAFAAASARQIARERAEDIAPIGECSFCGETTKPVVSSEEYGGVSICESCCDNAICSFMNRQRLLRTKPKRSKGGE
jgi:hypothetical protein